jgi:Cd2+/Zn2+-exporting ATPase
MVHQHFHLKDDIATEATRGKQMRVSLALIATLAGFTLLASSWIAQWKLLYGPDSFQTKLLALAGAILLSMPVLWHALKCFLKGHSHMDELAALAIIACFATQNYTVAGIVAFFMLLSELVETRTALGARASIESLIKLTPKRAYLLAEDGTEKDVKVKELKPGDIIRVRPGDNIPADGEVTNGLSSINEATITGESLPVDKVPGMQVFAGTNNLTGVLDIKVTKAGKDTTLGKVQSLIMQAEKTKIPIVTIIERYIKWYVPTILMIAIIFYFFTRDIQQTIVTKLTPAENIEPAELLAVAASAEQMSKHPAARALMQVAKEANLSLPQTESFEETPGKGVTATINSERIIVGRDTFLKENNIDMSRVSDPALHEEHGFSTLYVSRDSTCIGWIGLQDKTRPEARQAVKELLEAGIKRVIMLTGDREEVASRVAGELGCTDFKAHCLPQDKLSIVENIKKDGHTVVVVGDGINDAPALAAGDLGIAMGAAGSDVAINSASIALMSDDLKRLPFLVRLSRNTRKVIYENISFGISFILLGISLSFLIRPEVAAVLHFVSSLFVVFNSARLVRFGEELEHIPAH